MIPRHYGYVFVIFFYILILILGCVGLQKTYPERRYYVFDVTSSGNYDASPKHAVLKIRNFRISPAYTGHEFVYRVSADGYESDFYNQFFKSPDSLMTQEVFGWFSQINMFDHVVVAPSEIPGDYALSGYINSIYGDYTVDGSPKAVLALEFFLIKVDSGEDTILFSRSYRKDVEITAKAPTALVNGWNEALRDVLIELENDLSRLDLTSTK
jgi:cholesterol transport system auxiliary component